MFLFFTVPYGGRRKAKEYLFKIKLKSYQWEEHNNMSDLFDTLIENYFEPQVELLPDGTLPLIKAGKTIDIVTVKGANQLDITTSVELLVAVLTLVTTLLPLLPKKSKAEKREETRKIITRDYPVVARSLEEDELDTFIDDLIDGLKP
jgi:hypothetical protein